MVTGLVSAALVLTMAGPVLADELAEQQQELTNIQRQMEVQQGRVDRAQRQVDSVSGQLQQIQGELDTATSEYKAIQAKLEATERQIDLNQEILAKTEKSLAQRSKTLNRRMRDIYENGQISYLDVLLGSADFSDFATRLDVLKRLLNQDAALIAKVQAERALVVQKKADLERDRQAIIELQKTAAAKKSLVEARKQERKNVLETAVSERDTAERAYEELQETSRQIERMIRNAGSRGAVGSSGAMMWPYNGPITSEFGWRTHPIFGTARYHSGLDIGADYGDTVVAADGGVVIYSGWMGGYGYAVIIDHGGGISTLYGHNSELVVSEGQSVRKGQTIAYAGSTGYSTGPHVHFEVRQNGAPVNPYNYLP